MEVRDRSKERRVEGFELLGGDVEPFFSLSLSLSVNDLTLEDNVCRTLAIAWDGGVPSG